uniref:Uncharacterized protein n=1 Tax=Astatotilapia calliptera TaxID=8154 RepID=A0AAX7V9Z4_ASTCA
PPSLCALGPFPFFSAVVAFFQVPPTRETRRNSAMVAQHLRITCRCLMSLLMAAVMTGEASLPSFMLAFSVER